MFFFVAKCGYLAYNYTNLKQGFQGNGKQDLFTHGNSIQSNIIHTITQGKITLEIEVIINNKRYLAIDVT